MERYVLLVSDLPGISVRTVFQPSKDTPGASELVFILDRKAVGGFASVDNRGSRAIGPVEGQVKADFNSLLGLDEHTSLLFATVGEPRELQYGAAQSDWIVDPEGLQASLSGDYSHTRPGGAIATLDPVGDGWSGRASLLYPLIRSRSENFHIGVAIGARDTRTDLLSVKFSDDRIRYAGLNASFDVADTLFGDNRPASNILTAELSEGLDILGASKSGSANLSRANGHSDYTKLYVEATRVQTIAGPVSAAFSVSGQASSNPLLSAEQFGLGGSRFGRGYEPSELTGDEGIAGSIEARYALPTTASWLSNPQLYVFYDLGQIWNISPPAGTSESLSLASAGIGGRVDLFGHLSLNLELAKPLTRPIASRGNKDVRPLFGLTTRF